uniref:Uncharacterized protein n=1 Tax=Oryza glaberrima TaxID=4538 RepID=I1QAT9_ORYGL
MAGLYRLSQGHKRPYRNTYEDKWHGCRAPIKDPKLGRHPNNLSKPPGALLHSPHPRLEKRGSRQMWSWSVGTSPAQCGSAHPRPVRLLPAYRVLLQVPSSARRSSPADAFAVPGVSSSLHSPPELDEKHGPVTESCDDVKALDGPSAAAGCEIETVVAG